MAQDFKVVNDDHDGIEEARETPNHELSVCVWLVSMFLDNLITCLVELWWITKHRPNILIHLRIYYCVVTRLCVSREVAVLGVTVFEK